MVKNAKKAAAHDLGVRGEEAAAQWYRSQGFEILERNWRCFEGEIDVIAADRTTVVFCEVKTRTSDRFADPALAVGYHKQAKVRTTAFRWLQDQPWHKELRFDVALVVGESLRVIEDAF